VAAAAASSGFKLDKRLNFKRLLRAQLRPGPINRSIYVSAGEIRFFPFTLAYPFFRGGRNSAAVQIKSREEGCCDIIRLYILLLYTATILRRQRGLCRRRRLHLHHRFHHNGMCVLPRFPARNDVKLAENRRAPRPSCSFVARTPAGRRDPFALTCK